MGKHGERDFALAFGRRAIPGHGVSPHTPSMKSGIVRRRVLCGGQGMREHVLAGKLIVSDASENNKFCCPVIRVKPSAGARAAGRA